MQNHGMHSFNGIVMSFIGILTGNANNLTIKWHISKTQFNGGGTSTNRANFTHIFAIFPNIPIINSIIDTMCGSINSLRAPIAHLI